MSEELLKDAGAAFDLARERGAENWRGAREKHRSEAEAHNAQAYRAQPTPGRKVDPMTVGVGQPGRPPRRNIH